MVSLSTNNHPLDPLSSLSAIFDHQKLVLTRTEFILVQYQLSTKFVLAQYYFSISSVLAQAVAVVPLKHQYGYHGAITLLSQYRSTQQYILELSLHTAHFVQLILLGVARSLTYLLATLYSFS